MCRVLKYYDIKYHKKPILTRFMFWFSCYVRVPINNFTIVSPIHFIFKLSENKVSHYPFD